MKFFCSERNNNSKLIAGLNDGRECGGGSKARRDAENVPCMQGGLAHHRRRFYGHRYHTSATTCQEWLAGLRPR